MKKLPVIIADDDYLVLKDLKEMLNWENLGFSIAGMASSGEQALELVREHQPALLITDIRMMGMDGLDLIESAHKEFPEMQFLIISSYNEFDYARRAIANGVLDYLLKTEITPTALTQKLLETSSHFHKEELSSTAIYEQELSAFFSSENSLKITADEFPHLMTLNNEKYYFSMIACSHMMSRNFNQTEQTAIVALKELKNIVLSSAKDYCAKPITCIYKEFLVLGMSSDMSKVHPKILQKDFVNRLDYRLGSASFPCTLFYLPERVSIQDFRSFHQSLIPLIQYKLLFYPEKPLNMIDLKSFHYVDTNHPFPFHSLVFDEEHQEENILLVKDYIVECCSNYDIYTILFFYNNFCSHIEISSNNQMLLPQTLHAPTPEHFQKWVYNTLHDCIQILTKGLEYQYSPVVDSAVHFMVQNYSNFDLTAVDIADHVGLSANRLGVLLKQDTGKTINEYLNTVRVDKAISLLEKTNMKIYEISEKCGYKSSQYFSQIIYQKTGKRPIDFRKSKK